MTVKGGKKCKNWPDFPLGVSKATGGLIGDTVLICGGLGADECYSLTSEKITLVTHTSIRRFSAASIVIDDKTLWVTGDFFIGASTEYVTVTGTMIGPDLPIALRYHAMVAINSTCSMVIGGESSNNNGHNSTSALTFFYDHNEDQCINGPSLMQARGSHAAGIVTDEVTSEHFVAVTGGYYSGYWDSTEILQEGEWVQGKTIDIICYFLENFLDTKYSYVMS